MERKFNFSWLLVAYLLCASMPGSDSVWAQAKPSTDETAYRGNLRAYLGVFLGDAPAGSGALVGKVAAGSPAEQAGLLAGDIIESFGEGAHKTRIESAAQVYRWLGEMPLGGNLAVGIVRGGERKSVTVKLGERVGPVDPCQRLYGQANATQAAAQKAGQMAVEARRAGNEVEAKRYEAEAANLARQAALYREDVDNAISRGTTVVAGVDCRQGAQQAPPQLGLDALPLNEQLARFFRLQTAAGLLVTEVTPGGLADRHGFKAGDCLLSVNGQTLATPVELARMFARATETRAAELAFVLVREGREQRVKLVLPPQ